MSEVKKAKIEVSERDLKMLMNIPVFFKKGTFPLNGTEILVCAQTQEYLGGLIKYVQKELSHAVKSEEPAQELKKEEPTEEKKAEPKKRGRKPSRKTTVKE